MRPPSLIQSKAVEAAPFIFHLSHFYIQRAALLFPACLCRLPIAGGRDIIRNIYKVIYNDETNEHVDNVLSSI